MLNILFYILLSITAASAGILFSYFYLDTKRQKKLAQIKEKLNKRLLRAKEDGRIIINDAEKDVKEMQKEITEELRETERRLQSYGDRLKHRESVINSRLKNSEAIQKKVEKEKVEIENLHKEIEKNTEAQFRKLEEKTGIKIEEGKEEVINRLSEQIKEDFFLLEQKTKSTMEDMSEERARNIIHDASQRMSEKTSRDTVHYVFNIKIPQRDKLIGPKGETIRLLEELTKAEFLFDDANMQLYIGGYNLVNRTVAKSTVDKMLKKRRFKHDEIKILVQNAKNTISKKMVDLGQKTVKEFGITDFDPKMVKLIGRLYYRTSFGQNNLKHSREVTFFSILLASELGANIEVCKKAGMLHDIGKAVDTEIDGAHDDLTREICNKFGIDKEVTFAAFNHHGKEEFKTIESRIIQIADAISASRPGARQESLDRYIERLEQLEKVSNSFPGVEKAFAIQAGREVRIMVNPEDVSDVDMVELAKKIARNIEEEVVYPGEVKVNMSRETKSVEFAK